MGMGLVCFEHLTLGQINPTGDLLQCRRNQIHLERGERDGGPGYASEDLCNLVSTASYYLRSLQKEASSLRRRRFSPGRKRFGCRIHRGSRVRTGCCCNASKKLSAVGLVDLEQLFVCRFSPLVTGKIAILFHIDFCGWHC